MTDEWLVTFSIISLLLHNTHVQNKIIKKRDSGVYYSVYKECSQPVYLSYNSCIV